MSVLIFFGVLFVLILVHEWGHFIVAKKTNMRVDEFGIGFPPKVFGVTKGETEYTFNALPIGGFVRILGENGVDGETLLEADQARSFGSRPKWAQALVLIAGVTMNILFAWILFAITFMIGVPTAVDEVAATESAELVILQTLADSPSAAIPVGAVITGVTAGDMILPDITPSGFTEFITTVSPEPVTITYESGGSEQTTNITAEQGLLADDPDRYVIGASLSLVESRSESFGSALVSAGQATGNGLVAITTGLFTLIGQSVTGTADFTQVAGPVGIVGMVGDAAAFGLTALLTFTAIISLNLAVINLLPFPALDGGRLVFVAIEAVTGKDIPAEWAGRINLVGFGLLLLLMVAVTYNDINNLL
jgi:regulator of sigma E protease